MERREEIVFFLCRFCAVACIAILADFFLLYFFGFVRLWYHQLKQIAVFLHFVVNENPLLTSCCNCCPATPPAPLACWVRAGMAYPDLKV